MDSVYELDECRSYKHLLTKNLDLSQSPSLVHPSGSPGHVKAQESFLNTQVIDDFESESSDLFSRHAQSTQAPSVSKPTL